MPLKTPANNQKELTDADVVSGGPLDPNSPESLANQNHADVNEPSESDENSEDSAAPPAANPPAAPNPIIVNGRQFKDAAELAAYTSQIEILNRTQAQPVVSAPPAPELIDGRPISEVMFDNPERYHQYVLEKATEKARNSIHEVNNQKDQEKRFWDEFYEKNSDLKGMEEVVMTQFRGKFDELAKLPVEQAQARLATDSRSFVDKILQKKNVRTTELPSGGASTLGASGAGATRVKQPEPKRSFLEQVKAARRRA